MSKTLKFFLVFLLIFIAGCFIAPEFISLKGQKDEIIKRFKNETAENLILDDELKISLLPLPRILVKNVKLQSQKFPDPFFETKILEISLNLPKLLTGKIVLDSINFENASINLQVNENGEKNWEFLNNVSNDSFLSRISAKNSQIQYQDLLNQTFYKIRKSDFQLETDGKLNIHRLKLSEKSWKEQINLEAILNSQDNRTILVVFSDSFRFEYEGSLKNTVAKNENNFTSNGVLSASITNASFFAEEYLGIRQGTSLSQNAEIKFKTTVDFADGKLEMKEINFNSESIQGSGKIAADFKNKTMFDVNFKISQLNLDKIFGQNEENGSITNRQKIHLMKNLDMLIYASLEKVIFNGHEIKDAEINAEISKNGLEFYPSKITLPGDLSVTYSGVVKDNGIRSIFNGKIAGEGKNLQTAMKFFAKDLNFEQNNLEHGFNLKSDLILTNQEMRLSDYEIFTENMEATGNIVWKFALENPEIFINGHFSKIDLDYFNFSKDLQKFSELLLPNSKEMIADNVKKVRKIKFKTSLDFSFDKAKFLGKDLNNIFFAVDLQPAQLLVRKFNISSKENNFNANAHFDARALQSKLSFSLKGEELSYDLTKLFTKDDAENKQKAQNFFWSIEKFTTPIFGNMDVSFDLDLKKLILKGIPIKDFVFAGNIAYDLMKIDKLAGQMFNGRFDSSGNYNLENRALSLSFGFSNFLLEEFFAKTLDANGIKGYSSASGSISTYGTSVYELVLNMNSAIAFAGREVSFNEMNLGEISNLAASTEILMPNAIADLEQRILKTGDVKFKNLDGILRISHGNATLENVKMSNSRFNCVTGGSALMPKAQMSLASKCSFVPIKGAANVDFGIKIFGDFLKPNKSIELQNLEKYLIQAKRFAS